MHGAVNAVTCAAFARFDERCCAAAASETGSIVAGLARIAPVAEPGKAFVLSTAPARPVDRDGAGDWSICSSLARSGDPTARAGPPKGMRRYLPSRRHELGQTG